LDDSIKIRANKAQISRTAPITETLPPLTMVHPAINAKAPTITSQVVYSKGFLSRNLDQC